MEVWTETLNQFWNLWGSEYLLSLRERTQSFLKGPRSTAGTVPEVGDIVLIKENLPRGKWKIFRITELIKRAGTKRFDQLSLLANVKFSREQLTFCTRLREPNNDDNSSKVSKDVQIGSKEENSINEEIKNDDDDQPVMNRT